jgi:hypothetical protein
MVALWSKRVVQLTLIRTKYKLPASKSDPDVLPFIVVQRNIANVQPSVMDLLWDTNDSIYNEL